MKKGTISRRKALETGLMASVAAFAGYGFTTGPKPGFPLPAPPLKNDQPFRICLNTSTLLAYKLPVDQQIDLVAAAGFDGVELWMRDIKTHIDQGGSPAQLLEKLEEHTLIPEDIIAFSPWCSDDAEERKKALEQLQDEMTITAALGGRYIAAPVMGLKYLDPAKFDIYTERYLAILELEKETGVLPLLELWGTGALNRLADCAKIVIATGHPKATMLLDFYHLYRGGSDWDTLDCLNGARLPLIHMNDYPASPPREMLTDADRVLPGEGICPFDHILPKLYRAGFRGALSVELFNKGYWASMDAKTMLKNSYEKTVQVVEKALQNA